MEGIRRVLIGGTSLEQVPSIGRRFLCIIISVYSPFTDLVVL